MQVGDVVFLKSGSHDMTVQYIGEINGSSRDLVRCTWCIHEQFQEHIFAPEQLVKKTAQQDLQT